MPLVDLSYQGVKAMAEYTRDQVQVELSRLMGIGMDLFE